MHAKRLSRPMPRRAGCPTQRSSQHCRRARPPRCLTLPHMTWALRRTPSGRPVHPSQPTTLRKLGPRNANGSGDTSLPLSANSFSTINNAGAPSAGTPSTTDERRVGNARARSVHSRYTRCRGCWVLDWPVDFRAGPAGHWCGGFAFSLARSAASLGWGLPRAPQLRYRQIFSRFAVMPASSVSA